MKMGDEHRYGLMKVIRRCWTLKGHRPNDRYEWGYIYGALDIVIWRIGYSNMAKLNSSILPQYRWNGVGSSLNS